MDARPDELTDRIREKRIAIDNRLELLRVHLQQRDPRARLRQQWPAWAGALAAGGGALWYWRRTRKRRANGPAGRRRQGPLTGPRRSLWARPRATWDPWSPGLWR
jgi:LPXTG-motif cell wall-anchored protein